MLPFPIRLRPVILLLGDSLTQQGFGVNGGVGWASLVANSYSRRADVLNRGFSGYNSRHVLSILHASILPSIQHENILFCTVFLGTNDAALPGERQNVPLNEYEHNVKSIVSQVRTTIRNDVPIFLLTPPPVDLTRWNRFHEQLERDPSYRHNDVAQAYGNAVKRVCEDYENCFVVDVFDLLGAKDDEKFAPHLSDGLHLSSSGNELVFEGLLDVIERHMDSIAPERLGMDQYHDHESGNAIRRTQSTSTSCRPTIVLIGDSFTEFGFDSGWVSLLASDYSRRADVLNRGFQGYNTQEILALLPSILSPKPSSSATLFVTVWLGGNDAIRDERHVPLDEFENNLGTIVQRVRESIPPPTTPQGQCLVELPIILVMPPPVDDAIAAEFLTTQTTRQYANRVQAVAASTNCACLDLFDVFANSNDKEKYYWTDDGVHLNAKGNELVYSGLMQLLRTKFPQVAPMTDGNGKYGAIGIPLEEKLWHELC